ncbi:MAG: DUF4760 domain-containing protein [Chloroflexi bacterium]|nr:DUF4760 domain-containing protein [Chloroflexota bacterium]
MGVPFRGSLRNDAIGFQKEQQPISYDAIQESRKVHCKVVKHISVVLAFYQSLARGVEAGVYNRKIVDKNRATAMIYAYRALHDYLGTIRKDWDRQGLYSGFEEYARKCAIERGIALPDREPVAQASRPPD